MSDAPPDWYARNQAYARPGPYTTMLTPLQELLFKLWVQSNAVPFDPRAASAVNPNDQQMHYPDYWKTPYHQSFSADSQWALPGAPTWNDQDQLVDPKGAVIFDERAKAKPR